MTLVIMPRTLWLAGLVVAGVLITAAVLADLPGVAISSPTLGEFRRAVGQGQVLAVGAPTVDSLQPLASPLWLLLQARFSNDLALVARIVGGLSVVLCLFLAYQLCHGLSTPDEANEQSSLALLALALTPGFLLAAASGSSELPHLALLLATTLLIQQALGAEAPLLPMLSAGALAGLSVLFRPVSILLPAAIGLWLWSGRPFSSDEPGTTNLKPGLAFGAAFLVGAAPQLLMSLSGHSFPFAWGAAEVGAFWARLLADPLRVVAGINWTVVDYAAGDDLARFDAIHGSWRAGAWGSLIGAIIAMAPTILKVLGALGLIAICWLERFAAGAERARFPAVLLLLLVLGGALGLVDERGTLAIAALLAIFTFAGLSSLLPGTPGGLLGLALLTFLLLNQIGVGTTPNMAAAYRASDPIAAVLHERGVMPRQVMSASWSFYDTRTPWKERYRHIPGYVDSTEALIREMQRQGATHLVFDRRAGAEQWPRLASLLEVERPPAGLRPLKPLIQTDESPPNQVAIYTLE